MGIRKIHGFLKEKQKANPEWGSISIIETVLVEMDYATDNTVNLLTNLPADPVTPSDTNPKGISFTFDISTHPDSSVFILRKAGEIQQSELGGGFWEIPLTYAIFSYWELASPGTAGGNNNPRQRKDQREVTSPVDRPVVWNTSSSIVQKETFRKPDGTVILHTNGLPITSPFKREDVHETHTFSYNVEFVDFDYSFYDGFIGKVNEDACLGKATGKLKLSAFSASEEYESIGQGVEKTEYHYVRVTITFEYNPTGWDEDAKLVSMSTLQLKQLLVAPFTLYYDKIKTSETEYAQEPWPLLSTGAAVPYDDNDPNDYGYVDHGYPELADLGTVTAVKGLTIP